MPFFWDGAAPASLQLSPVPPGKMVQRPSFRGPALYFRLLAGLTRVWVHWVEGRDGELSLPCLRDPCQFCGTHELRWRGYAPALAYERGQWVPRVMEASENFLELLGRDLRGKGVTVWKETPDRKRHKESVPILYNFIPEEHLYALPELPEPFDFVPFLLRIWQKAAITDHEGREYTRFLTGGLREPSKTPPPWVQPAPDAPRKDRPFPSEWQAAWLALPDEERAALRAEVAAAKPQIAHTKALLEQECVRELARRAAPAPAPAAPPHPNGDGKPPPPKG